MKIQAKLFDIDMQETEQNQAKFTFNDVLFNEVINKQQTSGSENSMSSSTYQNEGGSISAKSWSAYLQHIEIQMEEFRRLPKSNQILAEKQNKEIKETNTQIQERNYMIRGSY